MPRSDDPRVMVRMSPAGHALVKSAADRAGVSVGGLMRECAERFAEQVAEEARAGAVRIRRSKQPAAVKRPPVPPLLGMVSGAMLERQQRLNAEKDSRRKGPDA